MSTTAPRRSPRPASLPPRLVLARNSVAGSFALNGIVFATFASRLPDVRERLDLSNGALGLLLLATSCGSLLALPATGWVIGRIGAGNTVRVGALLDTVGLLVAVLGAVLGTPAVTVVGLFLLGMGNGSWDVAMNVEGAEVERRLGYTIMPRFHAGWSLGSFLGLGVATVLLALHVDVLVHVGVVVAVVLVAAHLTAARFLEPQDEDDETAVVRDSRSAWGEGRTLALGLMVLAFALTEGTANDWLSLALIDGYDLPHWAGVGGFTVFVVAMTTGRLVGTALLDRLGRVRVLLASAACTFVGVLLTVFGPHLAVVVVGILFWGAGAALGFPVGMSAAADDPVRAAARVSVVSTIGYGAFLAGPPLLGWLADHVGTLHMLLFLAAMVVPSALAVGAARERPVPPDHTA
ncbi:MFS transporter [Nocardioides bruguierae]|uniref:MFS transporter n=1 Tax=Nocardioides bruguierae TaxID=2945102 RepID=A0A9X2IDM5_9ACTN|nr:MFS transporter [Nocardioides bruguierae]MCM0619178.1 MFS transporter [Nocardioides bruguierae]